MDKFNLDLQLFADGGAAGGDGGAAAAAAGDTGVQAPDAGGHKSRKRENPLANVQYGIQPGQTTEQVAPAGKAAEQGADDGDSFDSLIKGKYKADFDAHVQNIIRERFKNQQDNAAELEELRRLKTAVGKKFNVDEKDVSGLVRAVEYDEEALEEEAAQRGMTVETLKLVQNLEDLNADYARRERMSLIEQRNREHFNTLAQQAEALKSKYPDFDLIKELENERFLRMTAINGGFNVQQAYEAIHLDEILASNAQQQAQAYANSIRANGARPSENGLRSEQGMSQVKSDPRTWNKDDRAEVRRRVERGDKIYL